MKDGTILPACSRDDIAHEELVNVVFCNCDRNWISKGDVPVETTMLDAHVFVFVGKNS